MKPVKLTKNLINLFSYPDAEERFESAIAKVKEYFETHVISIDNVAIVDTNNEDSNLRYELYLGIDTSIAELMIDIMCVRRISFVSRESYNICIESGGRLDTVIVAKLVKPNDNGLFEYCNYFIQFTLPTFSFYKDVYEQFYICPVRRVVLGPNNIDIMVMTHGYKILMCPEFIHKDEFSLGSYVDNDRCFIKFTGLNMIECVVSTPDIANMYYFAHERVDKIGFLFSDKPPIEKLKDIDIPSKDEEYRFITDNGILSIIASSLRTKECTEDEIRTIIYKLVSQHRINSYRPKKERDE